MRIAQNEKKEHESEFESLKKTFEDEQAGVARIEKHFLSRLGGVEAANELLKAHAPPPPPPAASPRCSCSASCSNRTAAGTQLARTS